MRTWLHFQLLLSALLTVWAQSETTECNSVNCQQLQYRLEILEAAVRSIVSAIASQKKGPFAPINKILERDPAIREVLSPSIMSSTTHSAFENSSSIHGENNLELEKNPTIQLKGTVKCSLAHLLDINTAETAINPSGKIKASLSEDNSLEIEWIPRSIECLKYSSGVWIRVFESGQQQSSLVNSYVAIPKTCLKRRSNASFSIVLPALTSQVITEGINTCHFELKEILIKCRAYTVEVVPNYQSLKGRPMLTEIVIPPTVLWKIIHKDQTKPMESLISVSSLSNTLTLNWEDNSGCAPQLTSLNLEILPDGDESVNATNIKIPRSCLQQPAYEDNVFKLVLSTNHTCPVEWRPLDACRMYRLEFKSEYSYTWTGPPSYWETFVAQSAPIATSGKTLKRNSNSYAHNGDCQAGYFYCHDRHYYYRDDESCLPYHMICDGTNNCNSPNDENYCDYSNSASGCHDEFTCSGQCISKNKVCDGVYDCLDDSDENFCDSTTLCSQLTTNTGHFPMQEKPSAAPSFHKSKLLITVQSNHTIWLSFNRFSITGNHFIKIYDGPYSNSPLLLSHSGATKPSSIRSSYNNLYVELPSYYNTMFGIEVFYTSMNSTGQPFIKGCGGYVYGDGIVSSPDYLPNAKVVECVWFLEARQSDLNVYMKVNLETENTPVLKSPALLPSLTVYDGWSSSGQVLYDEPQTSPDHTRTVMYSIGKRMMVRFKPQPRNNNTVFYWDVFSMPLTQCRYNLSDATSGTIRSPNYPAVYPNSCDCRWNIVTTPNSKIRLLFAFFDTQEGFDYIYVYDGSTTNSSILLEKSGSASTLFSVNSTTNEMLVRFITDEVSTFPGFLAVYSTIE